MFHGYYQTCFVTGVLGYTIIISELFGITSLFFPTTKINDGRTSSSKSMNTLEELIFNFGTVLFFYGLYFGVLGRDMVDVMSEYMVSRVGYFNASGFPKKQLRKGLCGICGEQVDLHSASKSDDKPTFFLNDGWLKLDCCEHLFHHACIRGWVVLGKKDSCPWCKEKVKVTYPANVIG